MVHEGHASIKIERHTFIATISMRFSAIAALAIFCNNSQACSPQLKETNILLTHGAALYSSASKRNPAENIDQLLLPIRRKYRLPALSAAITTSSRLVAVGAVGTRKWRGNVNVTLNDPFHLGSDTKAMTATLLAMLVEKGKLHWNEALSECLPQFATTMLPVYRNVTVQELLQHRSGFSSDTALPTETLMQLHSLVGTPEQQRSLYTSQLLLQPPVAAPGSQYIYSNRNYAVLGTIEEHIAGMPWEQLITDWLFNPLGMKTAGFGAAGSPGKQDAPWGHRVMAGVHFAISPGPLADNPVCIAPAGEVHCSIEDWAKYAALQLRVFQGSSTLLSAATVNKLYTPQFGGNYAGGWLVTEREWAGGTVFTHAGSNTMNYCVVWMAPGRDFAVLVATNQGNGGAAKACDDAAAVLIKHFLAEGVKRAH